MTPQHPHRVVPHGGQTYHSECFVCDECKASLDGKSFFDLKERRVCSSCHGKKSSGDGSSSELKCAHCLKPIVPVGSNFTCAKIADNRYHNECVVCASCSVPLGDNIYVHAGQLLCKEHATAAKSKQ